MLLVQRTQLVLNYMQRREDFMPSFLRHLGTSAMMDLLLQMVIVPDNDPERFNLVNVSYPCQAVFSIMAGNLIGPFICYICVASA